MVQSIIVGGSPKRVHELAGPIASIVRKTRDEF